VTALLHFILKITAGIFAGLQLARSSCTEEACAAQSCTNSLVLRLTIRDTADRRLLRAAYQTTGTPE
jgi:hypothetical protein